MATIFLITVKYFRIVILLSKELNPGYFLFIIVFPIMCNWQINVGIRTADFSCSRKRQLYQLRHTHG